MTGSQETLAELSREYRDAIPADLRSYRSFEWYLERLYDDPKIARNAHQRVADMFDYYGTEYDEDAGVVEYHLASEDPLNDGENTFYGRVVHEAIHEFVNKVKSGARGLGPQKRIKLLLGPVGSGKSDFDRQVRRYYEAYTRTDDGRLYTFRWTNLCDVIPDQDPADDVVRSLGDPVVPRDCVPVPDASTESATTDGSPTADEPATTGDIDDCERADELEGGPDGELGRRRGKRCPDGDRRTEAPTRTDASADAPVDAPADGPADAPADTSAGTALVVPGGVRAWLRDVERRLDDVETGAGRKPGDGTHSPTDGTRSPTAEGRDAGLGTAVAVDRRALSWVARRVERLASRADGVR